MYRTLQSTMNSCLLVNLIDPILTKICGRRRYRKNTAGKANTNARRAGYNANVGGVNCSPASIYGLSLRPEIMPAAIVENRARKKPRNSVTTPPVRSFLSGSKGTEGQDARTVSFWLSVVLTSEGPWASVIKQCLLPLHGEKISASTVRARPARTCTKSES